MTGSTNVLIRARFKLIVFFLLAGLLVAALWPAFQSPDQFAFFLDDGRAADRAHDPLFVASRDRLERRLAAVVGSANSFRLQGRQCGIRPLNS